MNIDHQLYKLICNEFWTEIKQELQQEGFYHTRAFFRLPEEETAECSNKHTMRVIKESSVKTETLEYLLSYEEKEDRGFIGIIFLKYEKQDCQNLITEIIKKTKADTLILIFQTFQGTEEESLGILVETKKERWCSTTPISTVNGFISLPDEPLHFVHEKKTK